VVCSRTAVISYEWKPDKKQTLRRYIQDSIELSIHNYDSPKKEVRPLRQIISAFLMILQDYTTPFDPTFHFKGAEKNNVNEVTLSHWSH
jgi:hypothetical protein